MEPISLGRRRAVTGGGMMSEIRATGTLKMWDSARKYGFVQQDRHGEPDLFVHWMELDCDSPRVGQRVSFVAVSTDRGWRATDVEVLEPTGKGLL
jgi:cold shock CspA family protein